MKMLEAGKIVTTHGVRGEVRLDAWCDSPDFLLSVKTFYLEDKTPIKVEFSRVHKGRLNIKIKGYDSIDEAQPLINKVLYINKAEKKLEKGVYYITDLIGLDVVDCESGENYGVIKDIYQTGANDVYEISKNDKLYYIPAIKDVIINVDIENKTMAIKPIAGMFEV